MITGNISKNTGKFLFFSRLCASIDTVLCGYATGAAMHCGSTVAVLTDLQVSNFLATGQPNWLKSE
jgi:anaerobic glycerol-3-phosphate dehydrogenase